MSPGASLRKRRASSSAPSLSPRVSLSITTLKRPEYGSTRGPKKGLPERTPPRSRRRAPPGGPGAGSSTGPSWPHGAPSIGAAPLARPVRGPRAPPSGERRTGRERRRSPARASWRPARSSTTGGGGSASEDERAGPSSRLAPCDHCLHCSNRSRTTSLKSTRIQRLAIPASADHSFNRLGSASAPIGILSGLALGCFGMVTVSTPSASLAARLLSSRESGSGNRRANVP